MSSSSSGGAAAASSDSAESSQDSRGKRRRINAFEFAPRVAAQNSIPGPGAASAATIAAPEWSEDATFALLNEWGDRFIRSGRRGLSPDEWSAVAAAVAAAGTHCSESQCRNRLDTLKRKYRKELSRRGVAGKWVFFEKLNSLMVQTQQPHISMQTQVQESVKPASLQEVAVVSEQRLPWGIDNGVFVCGNMNGGSRDGPGDAGSDVEEHNGEDTEWSPMSAIPAGDLSLLAESVRKFGETYERVEKNRRQQMEKMERIRKEFYDDLEVEKRQILDQAREEIERICSKNVDDDVEEDGDESNKMNTTPPVL